MFKNVLVIVVIVTFSTRDANTLSPEDIPELRYVDDTVNPCDDFYSYTCGNYKRQYPKPDNGAVDQFSLLGDELINLGHAILRSSILADDPVALKKAKSAFSACINTENNENYGAVGGHYPEQTIIQNENGMPLLQSPSAVAPDFGWNDIGRIVATYGIPMIFDFRILQQSTNDNFWVVITRDLLSNPSMIRPQFVSNYDDDLEKSFRETAAPRTHTRSVFRRAEDALLPFDIFLRNFTSHLNTITDSRRTSAELIEGLNDMSHFMSQLYSGGIVEEDVEILNCSFSPTLRELQDWTDRQFKNKSGINWVKYMNSVFKLAGVEIDDTLTFVITDIKYVYGTINLIRQTPASVVKNFALLRVFLYLAPDSTEQTRRIFENYYKAKNYKLYDRWEYCTRKLIDSSGTAGLSFAPTHAYQKFFYNLDLLRKAYDMTKQIHDVFVSSVDSSTWMESTSKSAAIRKAENMLLLLAYPDFVEDPNELNRFYDNVQICKYTNYQNAIQIRAFKQAYVFSQVGQARQRSYWDKSPFQVNAYYNRPNNKIFLPISILNPAFFSGQHDLLDYARLGSIIGHEITHGFDEQGHIYDENGYVIPSWWTNKTIDAFNEKKECFIKQYDEYMVPEKNVTLSGKDTINENIADNGGIKQAYLAFKRVQSRKHFSVNVANYTIDQLFFIAYGTMWCASESDSYIDRILDGSGYSTNQFRVIGSLSNLPEFSNAFRCPTGSSMNPVKKCSLW